MNNGYLGDTFEVTFDENYGKFISLRSFFGRSDEIDRPVGRQKSTAIDRLRPTANTRRDNCQNIGVGNLNYMGV